jgi:hypothetical protein
MSNDGESQITVPAATGDLVTPESDPASRRMQDKITNFSNFIMFVIMNCFSSLLSASRWNRHSKINLIDPTRSALISSLEKQENVCDA